MILDAFRERLATMAPTVLARASEDAAARLQARMRTGTATPQPAGVTLSVHNRDPYLSDEWRDEIMAAIDGAWGAS